MATLITPVFRASYPSLTKAKKNQLNGKEEFSVIALFKKGEDLSKINAAILAATEEKFGKDRKKWPSKLKSPLRLQDEKEIETDEGKKVLPNGYEYGAYFMTLKSTTRPGLVDETVQPIIDDSQIYPGVYLRASINFYGYDQAGNRGVGVGLNNVQKVKDGDPLSGRAKPEDDFAPIAGAKTAQELFTQ